MTSNLRTLLWSALTIASVSAACTFSPHPKSGTQECSPGSSLCPPGYVCGVDNLCWLPSDGSGGLSLGGEAGGGPAAVGGAGGLGGTDDGRASSVASGGVLGTDGSSSSSGGTTSSTSLPTEGGYFVSGDWHGYAWTAAYPTGSTIDPGDFTVHAVGSSFCATGTALGESDYSGGGMIGFNLNQAQGQNTPLGTWQPASIGVGGIVVNVSNPVNHPVDSASSGTFELRVQLSGPNGASDANDRWCATIGAFDREILIPWTTFNTACWNSSGNTYAAQPLQSVDVLVAGGTVAAAYSFCVNSVKSAVSTTTSPVTCAIPSTYGSCTTGVSCGANGCCDSIYPYYCPQTKQCWATQEAAAADCGSTTCYACASCTKTCPAGQTLNKSSCTCNSTSNSSCTNICPGGGTPSAWPACSCPQCMPSFCPNGGTPSAWPACSCPQCIPNFCPSGGTPTAWPACSCPQCTPNFCPGGGTPSSYPACICPKCSNFCTGGGTPSSYPACICPTPICTKTCPVGHFLNYASCTCI
jgi:hypothetical protein